MLLFTQVFTVQQTKEILHVGVILPQISKAALSEETPHSSSGLEGFEQQWKFKNKHVNANKGACASYLSDSYKRYQIIQGMVFGSTLQINSHLLEGGESLFVYKAVQVFFRGGGDMTTHLRTLGSDFPRFL